MCSVNRLAKVSRDERGFILPFVLVVFAVGVLLLLPMMGQAHTGLHGSSATETKAEELHAADFGVEDALHWLLHEDPEDLRYVEASPGVWELDVPYDSVNGASVAVTIEESGDDLLVTSTATSPTGVTTVTALVSVDSESTGGFPNVFENAVTSIDGDVSISGGSQVYSDPRDPAEGDVFCGGTLYVSPSASIEGSVYAETGISMGWSTNVSGDASTPGTITQPSGQDFVAGENYEGAPNEDPPVLTEDEVNNVVSTTLTETDFEAFTPGPVTRSGTWKLKWWPAPDPYYPSDEYIQQDLDINTGASITWGGSVYVGDELKVNGSGATFTFEGPVVVMGDVTLQNGHVIFEDSLWVADGSSLNMQGSATAEFRGPVRVGGDLDLHSSGSVSFDSTIYVGNDFLVWGSRTLDISDSVYVGGNLELNGSSQISGGETVVVLGDVDAPGATKLGSAADLPFMLIPTGDFTVTGSGFVSALVYAPEASVSLSGSASVYGAVVCSSISITGSAQVEYPVDVEDREELPGGGGGGEETTSGVTLISYEVA